MTQCTIGNLTLAAKLFQNRSDYVVKIFNLPLCVRCELGKYLDPVSILRIWASCKAALPEEGVLSKLQDEVVRYIQHADISSRKAVLDALNKIGQRYSIFLSICRISKKDGFGPALQHFRYFATGEEIPALALKGNPAVTEALIAALPSLDEEATDYDSVPFTVDLLEALSTMSAKGNSSVIRAVAIRTQHANVWVRDTAVRALQCVASVGNKSAIRAALRCVDDDGDDDVSDDEYSIRRTTLETLKVIAEATNDSSVVDAIIEQIESDISEYLRLVALDVLHHVAHKGNVPAIEACVGCLEDDCDEIRQAAWEVIAHLARKGDETAISACLASIEDENIEVACAAVEILGKLAPKGHVAAVGCLVAALHSRSRGMLMDQTIIGSLSRVATRGNHTVVHAMMQFIARTTAHEEQTRKQEWHEWFDAFESLRNLAAKDDVTVVSFIASLLGSNVRGVRENAAYSLYHMLEGSTTDSSWAWLPAVRTELHGLRPMEQGEGTHDILRDMLRAQVWLPNRRLRQKSSIVPRSYDV